jgi:hypothetical protein
MLISNTLIFYYLSLFLKILLLFISPLFYLCFSAPIGLSQLGLVVVLTTLMLLQKFNLSEVLYSFHLQPVFTSQARVTMGQVADRE